MNNKLPYISIIVPVYNGENIIDKCILSLLNQNYPANKYEIIIVDNCSTDNTEKIIKQYDVKYLNEKKRGPSAARNLGIQNAKGDILIFIDADCQAIPDLILNHAKTHMFFKKNDSHIKIIGGGIRGINKNFWALCDDICSWYRFHPKLNDRLENRHLPTTNLSVNRLVFIKTGMFDESKQFGEDVDFCKRAKKMGYKIYFRSIAYVYHLNRTSFSNYIKHIKGWARGEHYEQNNDIKNRFVIIDRFFEYLIYCIQAGRYYTILFLPVAVLYKILFFLFKIMYKVNNKKN